MQYKASLTRKKKFFVSKCLSDLNELKRFYGRESGCLDYDDMAEKYGKDIVETCLLNGWIAKLNKPCPSSPNAKCPCWITHEGSNLILELNKANYVSA